MARTENYNYNSSDDNHTPIHGVRWEPDAGKEVVATIQLVHGMQEYIERYDEFARFLADRGFAVFGHDHIGHGESVERLEDLGIMHSQYPDDTMVDDMYENYRIIKDMYRDKPYFILGHSMGSYLLRKFLSVKAPVLSGVNGAIIMGTGSEGSASLIIGNTLCSALMAIKGRDSKSSFVRKIMFGSAYKKFDTTGGHPENSWLSRNVENVKKFMDPTNPKANCEFSLNGYKVLLRSIWYDIKMSNIRRMNMDIPVIFVSGDQDPVGLFGKGVRISYEKFKAAGVKDLSIKLYEGDRHEILNELDREVVYNDLYNWMLERFNR